MDNQKVSIKDHKAKIYWYKYTILRRIIQHRENPQRSLGTDTTQLMRIRNICNELEGKSLLDLATIHRREIGY